MSIEDLCTETDNRRPLNKRYPPAKVDQYVARLARAIELETAGSVMPSYAALVKHFRDELDIEVTRDTIRRHLGLLRTKGEIWHP